LEITHPLASKESALRQLAGLLKIEPTATMAIGDEHNDLGMIKTAGIGVAMGNAVSQLRAIADQVTADNNHNGVGEAILKWR
nr:HAD hydrolase family protein [Bifidobacterium bifidum]